MKDLSFGPWYYVFLLLMMNHDFKVNDTTNTTESIPFPGEKNCSVAKKSAENSIQIESAGVAGFESGVSRRYHIYQLSHIIWEPPTYTLPISCMGHQISQSRSAFGLFWGMGGGGV